jgi:ParB-like chromosome segregation protein Spo0J
MTSDQRTISTSKLFVDPKRDAAIPVQASKLAALESMMFPNGEKAANVWDPITVTPRGKRFEIIDGRTRYMVLSAHKVKQIPCVVVEADGLEVARIRAQANADAFNITMIDHCDSVRSAVDAIDTNGYDFHMKPKELEKLRKSSASRQAPFFSTLADFPKAKAAARADRKYTTEALEMMVPIQKGTIDGAIQILSLVERETAESSKQNPVGMFDLSWVDGWNLNHARSLGRFVKELAVAHAGHMKSVTPAIASKVRKQIEENLEVLTDILTLGGMFANGNRTPFSIQENGEQAKGDARKAAVKAIKANRPITNGTRAELTRDQQIEKAAMLLVGFEVTTDAAPEFTADVLTRTLSLITDAIDAEAAKAEKAEADAKAEAGKEKAAAKSRERTAAGQPKKAAKAA